MNAIAGGRLSDINFEVQHRVSFRMTFLPTCTGSCPTVWLRPTSSGSVVHMSRLAVRVGAGVLALLAPIALRGKR